MDCVTISITGGSFVIIISLLIFTYWLQTKNYKYWKDRGMPYITPNWFFGNMGDAVLKKSTSFDVCCIYYKRFKDNGFGQSCSRKTGILMNSLYFATGKTWREMRLKLIPIFTSIKVKGMLDQTLKCCDIILGQIEESIEKGKPVEMESLICSFSTEAIASCIFGVQIMSNRSESKRFKELLNSLYSSFPAVITKNFMATLLPRLAHIFGIKTINKQVTDFFVTLTKGTLQYRQENLIKRNDLLHMIMALEEEESNRKDENYMDTNNDEKMYLEMKTCNPKLFNEQCIASIMFNFLTAGPTPTSLTVSFALFEIANNSSIEKKLQIEIDSAITKNNGWIFDAFKNMPYLDQVIQETLRLYTYKPSLIRTANKPYRLPGTNLTLEKEMIVYIPLAAVHLDPQYYSCPQEFNPDRFEGNNYKPTAIFMPFGYGPRICICIRFAVIMMKVCIAKILFKYRVNIYKNMKLPLNCERGTMFLKAEGGISLAFKKRSDCF